MFSVFRGERREGSGFSSLSLSLSPSLLFARAAWRAEPERLRRRAVVLRAWFWLRKEEKGREK